MKKLMRTISQNLVTMGLLLITVTPSLAYTPITYTPKATLSSGTSVITTSPIVLPTSSTPATAAQGGGSGTISTSTSSTTSPSIDATQPATPAQAVQKAAAPNDKMTAEEQKIFDMLNSFRVQNGQQPLKVDMRLVETARWKANDMINYNYFGHYSSVGSPQQLAASAGFNFLFGENIAQASSADEAFSMLVNSTMGHREKMLMACWTHVGIGIVHHNNQVYVVQHFGAE